MNFILLTSCFKPILSYGVSNQNVLANIQLAHETLERFISSPLCRAYYFRIYLIDCSDNDSLSNSELCAIDKYFISNSSVSYHNIRFKPSDIESIRSRGKGYSELLMIDRFLRSMSFPSDAVVFKSSARYTPLLSPSLYFPFFISSGCSFAYSNLARKAITHSFLSHVYLLEELISFASSKVDDSKGFILESIIYDFITQSEFCSSPVFKRSLFYPFYHPKVNPGTSTSRPILLLWFFSFCVLLYVFSKYCFSAISQLRFPLSTVFRVLLFSLCCPYT